MTRPDLPQGEKVFPFYLVLDVSSSMWSERHPHPNPYEVMQSSLLPIFDEISDDLTARDTAHVSIIEFGTTARTLLPLTPVAQDPTVAQLGRQTKTDYKAAFDLLAASLSRDIPPLLDRGNKIFTPAVYFLTDGQPETAAGPQPLAEWLPARKALDSLTHRGRSYSPTILALGLGTAKRETLREVRSTNPPGVACVAKPGANPASLVGAVVTSIMKSVSASPGAGTLVFTTPAGMETVD